MSCRASRHPGLLFSETSLVFDHCLTTTSTMDPYNPLLTESEVEGQINSKQNVKDRRPCTLAHPVSNLETCTHNYSITKSPRLSTMHPSALELVFLESSELLSRFGGRSWLSTSSSAFGKNRSGRIYSGMTNQNRMQHRKPHQTWKAWWHSGRKVSSL